MVSSISMSGDAATSFIRANTTCTAPTLTPEIRLHLAHEVIALWTKTEEAEQAQVPPPYWGFAWPGGQALARYILDNPSEARGRDVLDFGAGSGLVAIAAAKVGARVTATDIDPLSAAAIALNAHANNATLTIETVDLIGRDANWQAVYIGDICYERPLVERLIPWLRTLAGKGVRVLMGDPGRTYFPVSGVEKLAEYAVPVTRDLEDRDICQTGVYRLLPE